MKKLLLGLYPARWRDRYGAELSKLVDDTGVSPMIAIDLIRGAVREHRRTLRQNLEEEIVRVEIAHRHPTTFGVLAALIVIPTAVLVGGSLLGHELGITAVASMIDPLAVAVEAWRPADLFLVVAPALAVLVATVPLLEVGLRRVEGGPSATLAIRLRWLNLAVAIVALGVGLLLVGHHLSESALEAAR